MRAGGRSRGAPVACGEERIRGSEAAEPDGGAQEFLRVDRVAVDAGLVVQVRAGGAPGRADLADDLADAHVLALADVDGGEMAVARRQAVAVIDFHHFAVAAAPAGEHDFSGGRDAYRLARAGADVDSGMHGERADERIHPDAEAGRELQFAGERLAHRHLDHGAVEVIDMGARQIDAVELTVERATVTAVHGRDRHEGTAGRCRRHRRHLADVDAELAATRVVSVGSARDSSRASRSRGATRMTVSLIGDGFGGAISLADVRAGGLMEPVGMGSAPPAALPSVAARDSSVAWRRMSWSSFCSNCSWSRSWRLVRRSTWPRRSAMRSS